MIRVYIIEDDPIMREMLNLLLARRDDLTVAGMASTGDEALDSWNADEVDVTLLDLSLPGTRGLEVLRILKERAPEATVIVISGTHRVDAMREVQEAGANGFVLKGDPKDIIAAIHGVMDGGTYFGTPEPF